MNYFYVTIASILGGYLFFVIILRMLPKRLKLDLARDRAEIIEDGRRLAAARRKHELERFEEEQQLASEQLTTELNERSENSKVLGEDLDARERSLQLEEVRIQKIEKDLEIQTAKTELIKNEHEKLIKSIQDLQLELIEKLEVSSGQDSKQLRKTLKDSLIEARQIEYQKTFRILDDELSSASKRLATRLMSRALARYEPNFYWPKSVNSVEIQDLNLFDKIATQGLNLLDTLKAKAQCEVELIPPANDYQLAFVKFGGGSGIDREAARVTLEEIIMRDGSAWDKGAQTYDRHRAKLENHAITLGRMAVKEVQLSNIHPEIQKLIGYLNWRTSYRQNQWYHTVEVAKLAGIIAAELGIDVDAAKRCGLLHDIGKALDYKIEGSHAVISGDYADRFGESRVICDTVMSHHNDLIVESPLAYVLRTADTLSGARPGARVNLEEGYQLRLSGIEACVRSFPGIVNIAIMNGAREVHVEVNHKRVPEHDLESLAANIARKVEEEVAFPGEIKILVSRRFEATAVA